MIMIAKNLIPTIDHRGIMAFKPSPLSEDLLQKWKASLETPDINQVKFNSLVKKSAIKHKYLPRKEFPDGLMYFDRSMRSNVVHLFTWFRKDR
jgi:hypothetical protein